MSAEGNIGTLAEECLEALRDNVPVYRRVSEARRATNAEKRKIAMEKRAKILQGESVFNINRYLFLYFSHGKTKTLKVSFLFHFLLKFVSNVNHTKIDV